MASNYAGFTVTYEDDAGVIQNVGPGIDVAVYDTVALADAAESPLTTGSGGDIASGSLAAVAAGTKIRFRVENYGGRAFSIAQITT